MSYIKAAEVLPKEIIDIIQNYIDGECIYIPRKEINRRSWGDSTNKKEETSARNMEIFNRYKEGATVSNLSKTYYLSPKSIQKIIAKYKSI